MEVILLAPTPPPAGGIASWTKRMLNTELKNGWEVYLVDEKLLGERQVFGNDKLKLLVETKRTFKIWRDLICALRRPKAKLVHACIPATTNGMVREIGSALLAKVFRKKFIIHFRCTLPNMINTKISKFLFKILSRLSDFAIVLNTPSYDFYIEHCDRKVEIIPNFIDEDEINNRSKDIKEKIKTVLYVGGVIESKGCKEILQVAKYFPEKEFRLIGNVEDKILKSDRPKNVILLGEKEKNEVEIEMQQADLFMFVSYFNGEGFSNALSEAMGAGLPCLVTDWAANKDMIGEDGGRIVKIKDWRSMIEEIKYLDENFEVRKLMSNRNRTKVKNEYSKLYVTSQYVDIYEQLT